MKNTEIIFGIRLPQPVARGLAVLLAIVVYATVSSIARPERSSAQGPGVTLTPAKQLPGLRAGGGNSERTLKARDPGAAPDRNAQGWRLLGELVGGEHRVWVYGSPDGPRYTVCTQAGKILQEDLEADEVYRAFPDLDITGMRLEPRPDDSANPGSRGSLMTADKGT